MLYFHATVLFKESSGSCEVAGAIDGVTDAAHFLVGADLHGAFGHMHGSPEFILIAVRIGKIDDRAFVPFSGGSYGIGVRDLVLIESSQVFVDVFGADVESATGRIFTQLFCRRVILGLKEGADAARAAFPPHEAKYRSVFFPGSSRESIDRSYRKACGIQRPVSPARQVVRSDHVM